MGQSESQPEQKVTSVSSPSPPQTVTSETFPTYTRAIVRQIPNSIRYGSEAVPQYYDMDCCSWFLDLDYDDDYYQNDLYQNKDLVDLRRARRQHERYVLTLRALGLDVTVLPADESTPDCPFVEDTCVVVGNRALVTRPEGMVRRRELAAVESCLRSLGLEVHRIHNTAATLEGGDVVFTGTEFFVGESTQSNWVGHRILADTFPEYPVHSIPLYPPEFHLKGVACCAAPGVIALANNSAGRRAWDVIRREGKSSYQPLWLPDSHAVDCIYVNGTVLHCTKYEGRRSWQEFVERFRDLNRIELSVDELGKVQAALSCCSVIF